MSVTARRAAPLPAGERRAAILQATVPLVREHGMRVSTRQIAAAAGVAEGTLFRVFPDKQTLVEAAVQSAFAPEPLLAELARVDPALSLDDRLLVIVGILQRRLHGIIELMAAVGMHRPPGFTPNARGAAPPGTDISGARQQLHASHGAFVDAVAALLEPDRELITTTPHKVAKMLRLLTFAGTHPGITDGDPLTGPEIVAVILDGVRRRDGSPTETHSTSRKRNPSNARTTGREA